MFRSIFKFIFDKAGWSLQGQVDPTLKKFIVVVGPHTANRDFIIGIMARSLMKINQTKYLGKSQLFKFPYGFLFRMLGGHPVERTKSNNLVDSVVSIFNSHEEFSIGLAPEGTRSKVKTLKTGFYHIARKANIPIILVAFDFATKKIIINDPFYPTSDILTDFKYIIGFLSSYKGQYPELGIDEEMFERMKPSLKEMAT